MSEQEEELEIRSILVALDASRHSLAALRAAAELASKLEAELQGLFVEDANLLRVAGLPVARELRFPFGTQAQLNPARMERQLRAQAAQARQALASVCERRQVRWTFRVVRGDVPSKVLEAAEEADLLSLGKAGRPLLQRVRMGSTARAAATKAPRSVLLLHGDAAIRPPVVAPHDGSPDGRRALMLAAHLAQGMSDYLSILVMANAKRSSEELQAQIAEWLGGRELVIRYRELIGGGVRTLIEGVRTEGSGMLILSGGFLSPDEVKVLLDEVDCPVLLVR